MCASPNLCTRRSRKNNKQGFWSNVKFQNNNIKRLVEPRPRCKQKEQTFTQIPSTTPKSPLDILWFEVLLADNRVVRNFKSISFMLPSDQVAPACSPISWGWRKLKKMQARRLTLRIIIAIWAVFDRTLLPSFPLWGRIIPIFHRFHFHRRKLTKTEQLTIENNNIQCVFPTDTNKMASPISNDSTLASLPCWHYVIFNMAAGTVNRTIVRAFLTTKYIIYQVNLFSLDSDIF